MMDESNESMDKLTNGQAFACNAASLVGGLCIESAVIDIMTAIGSTIKFTKVGAAIYLGGEFFAAVCAGFGSYKFLRKYFTVLMNSYNDLKDWKGVLKETWQKTNTEIG